ncbi:hypothetical protein EG68_02053 [Paragonimus skrjabini miyazakii]|uniref:Thioredoxin peroxidase n=1 Tax=Paragonimus skrjabini miyazakii TaxID=59628 RepID=A0A8S9Z5N9_9TREM|nr:hypothetical protein EG68_02053 [Paragonimus skrjabini miyazakii]
MSASRLAFSLLFAVLVMCDRECKPRRAMLQPNQPAPEFKGTALVDGQFKEISLADFRGKYVVLLFYPLDFTFVCPTELIAFSDEVANFTSRNAVVIACSTDSVYAHLQWTKMDRKAGGVGKMNIPMLSDKNMKISRAYGVLDEEEGNAYRGLFIIDPNGVLRQITVNDRPVGRSVDEAIRLLDAFIFHEKHGEVCPANWKPNSKTIKPDPVGSQAYFSSAS